MSCFLNSLPDVKNIPLAFPLVLVFSSLPPLHRRKGLQKRRRDCGLSILPLTLQVSRAGLGCFNYPLCSPRLTQHTLSPYVSAMKRQAGGEGFLQEMTKL